MDLVHFGIIYMHLIRVSWVPSQNSEIRLLMYGKIITLRAFPNEWLNKLSHGTFTNNQISSKIPKRMQHTVCYLSNDKSMFTTKLLSKATNLFFIFELGWPFSELSDNIFQKIYFYACLGIHCILTFTINIIRMYFGNYLILNYRITHEIDLRHKFQWSWNNLLTLTTTALGHHCSDRARWLVSVKSHSLWSTPHFWVWLSKSKSS